MPNLSNKLMNKLNQSQKKRKRRIRIKKKRLLTLKKIKIQKMLRMKRSPSLSKKCLRLWKRKRVPRPLRRTEWEASKNNSTNSLVASKKVLQTERNSLRIIKIISQRLCKNSKDKHQITSVRLLTTIGDPMTKIYLGF